MRIGIHVGRYDWEGGPETIGPTLRDIAHEADQAGLDSLWLMDHLFQLGTEHGILHGPVEAPMLEGYVTLAHLAAVTERIQLGLLVGCATYRPPGLLVKTVTTIDVLSGGRTAFGLGAGWYEREAVGLGLSLPPVRERFERMEETLQIALHLWSGDRAPFSGRHYQLAEPRNVPQPLHRPRPPILIGGDGERRTLRLVARYADIWNNVVASPQRLPEFGVHAATVDRPEYERQVRDVQLRKLDVLRQHCTEAGRDYDAIEKSLVTYLRIGHGGMSADGVIELCRFYADLGFQQVMFNLPDLDSLTPLEILGGHVRPAVEEW